MFFRQAFYILGYIPALLFCKALYILGYIFARVFPCGMIYPRLYPLLSRHTAARGALQPATVSQSMLSRRPLPRAPRAGFWGFAPPQQQVL